MSLFKMELLKLRRSRIWLPLVILPLFSVLFGAVNYAGNVNMLQHEWFSLWTQVYLFYGAFFFPTIIGVVCAFIWHREHQHGALKLLLSSAHPFWKIILTKIMVAWLVVIISQMLFLGAYSLAGLYFRFQTAYPAPLLMIGMVYALFSLSLIALQTFLSLLVRQFAVPVLFSMFFGIFSFAAVAQNILPFLHQVFSMSNIALAINQVESTQIGISSGEWLSMIVYTLLLTFLFAGLQVLLLKHKIR